MKNSLTTWIVIIAVIGILGGFTVKWVDQWGIAGNGIGPWVIGLLVACIFLSGALFGMRKRE